jgi:hypothetical protein
MTYLPLRRMRALALACPLVLSGPALAFDASGNQVADTFMEILEAGNATVTGYDGVTGSGGDVVIKGLRATVDDSGKTSSLTIAETAIAGGSVDGEGKLSAATMTMTGVAIEDTGGGDKVSARVETIAIADAVLPSAASVKAKATADAIAPSYSSAELTGIVVDTEDQGTIPIARARAVIAEMDGDLPTAGSLSMEGIEIAADQLDAEERKTLTDLGYDKIMLGLEMQIDWDPASGVLEIQKLTLSGDDAATVNATLRLNGVTREVIEQLDAAQDNPEKAMGILQGLLVESLTLRIDNASLVERVLDNQAKEAGSTREVFVEQMTGALPFMLSMINNPPFQAKVAAAATTFLKDPKSISATAMPSAPVPFAQVLGTAMMAPQTLPDILGVTITANEN